MFKFWKKTPKPVEPPVAPAGEAVAETPAPEVAPAVVPEAAAAALAPEVASYEVAAEAAAQPAAEAPVEEAPVFDPPAMAAPAAAPGKKSWRERLSGSAFARSLGSLFSRKPKLDEALLEELETALITADVGVAASTELVEDLRKRLNRREFDDADQLLAALRQALIELVTPIARPRCRWTPRASRS